MPPSLAQAANEPTAAPQIPDPVTFLIARRVRAGREEEYEAWTRGILEAAHAFSGYLGANVFRPAQPKGEWMTVMRFASPQDLLAWETSAVRRDWLRCVQDLTEQDRHERISGLDYWFTAPNVPTPPRWKIATLLAAAVFAFAAFVSPYLLPLLRPLPWPLPQAIIVALQVALLTYIIMPALTRIFHKWLHP